ncbi:hypothetical protein CYMTET_24347 [Cymbomonas tetramitiformis]|uniref:ABM domain-containing protein n=1 Tax=Cymbomonas tetramitiformis TaxID=36881 RepID=A0AAE0FVZ0_9CHLO|nr:hypothetical protein CYMTET_24347 [Cymbomonas tetramitiformis]
MNMHATSAPVYLRVPQSQRALVASRPRVACKASRSRALSVRTVGEAHTATTSYKCFDAKAETSLKAEWDKRLAAMQAMQGFQSFELEETAPGEFTSKQTWASKEAYEQWMLSDVRRKSHFFGNIYQLQTKDKWSVPEDFMPVIPLEK